MASEKKDIDKRLATSGLSAAERTQLERRAQALTDQQRQTGAARADAALLLASTPMRFTSVSVTISNVSGSDTQSGGASCDGEPR